jgi:hypothetical protein
LLGQTIDASVDHYLDTAPTIFALAATSGGLELLIEQP